MSSDSFPKNIIFTKEMAINFFEESFKFLTINNNDNNQISYLDYEEDKLNKNVILVNFYGKLSSILTLYKINFPDSYKNFLSELINNKIKYLDSLKLITKKNRLNYYKIKSIFLIYLFILNNNNKEIESDLKNILIQIKNEKNFIKDYLSQLPHIYLIQNEFNSILKDCDINLNNSEENNIDDNNNNDKIIVKEDKKIFLKPKFFDSDFNTFEKDSNFFMYENNKENINLGINNKLLNNQSSIFCEDNNFIKTKLNKKPCIINKIIPKINYDNKNNNKIIKKETTKSKIRKIVSGKFYKDSINISSKESLFSKQKSKSSKNLTNNLNKNKNNINYKLLNKKNYKNIKPKTNNNINKNKKIVNDSKGDVILAMKTKRLEIPKQITPTESRTKQNLALLLKK